jgi:predicted flavoprotein YhiN
MPLNITDPQKHVAVLNKWATAREKEIANLNSTVTFHNKLIDNLVSAIKNKVQLKSPVVLPSQGASVSSKTLFTPSGTDGSRLYRVSYYVVVSRAATTSSSITVTLSWNDGVTNQTFTSVSPTNTLGDNKSGDVVVYGTASKPISYSTTYASTGATSMQYALYLRVEPI